MSTRFQIDGSVTIRRPVSQVYRFYRDFTNLPRFLGDVMAVQVTGPLTSHWTVQAPLGTFVNWNVQVTEEQPGKLLRYQTDTAAALRTCWELSFAEGANEAEANVRELMDLPLGRLGQAALALLGKPAAAEVAANLQRLKELMETGKVRTRTHSVKGKFSRIE